jgi:hypothetical protein
MLSSPFEANLYSNLIRGGLSFYLLTPNPLKRAEKNYLFFKRYTAFPGYAEIWSL